MWGSVFIDNREGGGHPRRRKCRGGHRPWDHVCRGGGGCLNIDFFGRTVPRSSRDLATSEILQLSVIRNVPVTPTPSIFPKLLPYKWGAYCRRNGRRTAVQMGGVLQGFPFFEA